MKKHRVSFIRILLMILIIAYFSNVLSCGKNSAKSNHTSMRQLQKKADIGDSEAQFELGYLKISKSEIGRQVTDEDYKTAVKWWRLSAKQGHKKAQYNLGYCYFNGFGVYKDVVDAVKWYRLSANQLYVPALFDLGICFYYGEGVVKDLNEAYFWFNLSAIERDEKAKRYRDSVMKEIDSSQINQLQDRASNWFDDHHVD